MPTQLIMQSLSKAIIQTITSLLFSGDSYVSIKDKTDISARVISKIYQKYCPKAAVSSGSHLTKLSDANIIYTKKLFHINKIKTAVQVSKTLSNINITILSIQTMYRALKSTGWVAVVKQKKPKLTKKYKSTLILLKFYWSIHTYSLLFDFRQLILV